MKIKPIRHGENLLYPVSKASGESSMHKIYIVGHSETGHHHVLESKTEFEVMDDQDKKELYLRLFEPAKLVHKKTVDKHKTLSIPAGTYRVIRKAEYNPWEKVMQRVFD